MTTLNQPSSVAVAYIDLEQTLGSENAQIVGKGLVESVGSRAKDIVAAGGFTSEKGLEKVLRLQAESIVNQHGRLYLCVQKRTCRSSRIASSCD